MLLNHFQFAKDAYRVGGRVVLLQLQRPAAAEIFEKFVDVNWHFVAIALGQSTEIQLACLGDSVRQLRTVCAAAHLVIVNQTLQIGLDVTPPFANLLDFELTHASIECKRNNSF